MTTYADIEKANSQLTATDIKGKPYMEVNQRIKAFRMVYPTGYIHTHIFSLSEGVCIMTADVGYYDEAMRKVPLGKGTAYEKEGSTFINKTSYIENAETSAVGRALGMCGFGVDASVASAEEVQNAQLNQDEHKATEGQLAILRQFYQGENLSKLLTANNIERIEDLPLTKASALIQWWKAGENNG